MSFHCRLTLTALLMLATLAACTPRRIAIDLAPTDAELEQTTVVDDGRAFSDRVALIDVSGMIVNTERPRVVGYGEHPVSLLHEQLVRAANDDNVKAIILRLNTPGGTVTASDAMYREVQRFKRRTNKPVIALMMDVATSGGYYVACAADDIVAYPTSVTGSIGVIIQNFSVKPALSRLGIQSNALTSGPNKDAGSPFSRMTDEHRAVLQGLVDDYYQRFRQVVRERRPGIGEQQFDMVTDGRVMSGQRAEQLGVVDRTGDVYDAFALARRRAGLKHADLVRYHRPAEAVGSPYARAPVGGAGAGAASGGTQVNVLQLNVDGLAGIDAPLGMYYLWRPQASFGTLP